MRKLLFVLISFCLFSTSCKDQPAQGESMSLEGYELFDVSGTDIKQAAFRDAKGKILEQGTIRNGKKHGTWVSYRKDRDVPQVIANYVDGALNGPYFEFAPYGQVSLACNYSNNQLHGQYFKYKSVRKSEEGYYVNGKMDGIYKKYYDGSETVQQEISYKNGIQDGEHLFYNDKGEVTMRYSYKNGEKQSGGVVAQN